MRLSALVSFSPFMKFAIFLPYWLAYIIVVGGKWASFALTNDDVHIEGITRAIVEFFVVRKYRRQGVCKRATQTIMEANRACWVMRVLGQHQDAGRFWAELLDKLWPAKHREAIFDDERWRVPVFSIDTQQ